MISYTLIDTPQKLINLCNYFVENQINELAMDFEEESNLHVYGEHLCLIQLYDKSNYYIIDPLEILKFKDGTDAIKTLLEGSIQKIMFDCSSDASIVRKTLNIHLKNIYDLRIAAKSICFNGNLNALIHTSLNIKTEETESKKKYQMANWMKRPIPEEQLSYALGDVKYLFDLKSVLEKEIAKLPVQTQNQIASAMRSCASQKHKDRPGWEKICNYRSLKKSQKIYLRYFFNARDNLARKANTPATNIIEKQILVAMAKTGTWEGLLTGPKLKFSQAFEQARLDALQEIKSSNNKAFEKMV